MEYHVIVSVFSVAGDVLQGLPASRLACDLISKVLWASLRKSHGQLGFALEV